MGTHTTQAQYLTGARIAPQAIDLEKVTLGAIMLDREALPAVIDILKPESFYLTEHVEIYRACLELFAKCSPIDILTVTTILRDSGRLSKVGGSAYLVELTNMVASAANIEYHARIVAQKALARDMIGLAQHTINEAYSDADPFQLLHETQKASFDLANFSGRNALHASQIGIKVLKQIEQAMRKGDGITGVPTSINALDEITGGWQPTDLIILAARPGMGKTAFVLCTALHAAKQGIQVGIFSLEMGSDQLFQRLASMETGIPAGRIKRGKLSDWEWQCLADAIQALSALPIYIDDTPGLNIFELRAKARRLKMQHGIQMLIVDYLQLMAGSDEKRGNREQEVSAISRGLKTTAKELEVPLIALSQLSRAVEIRGGSKRPMLSDLRESGSLEQDADIVGFIYRAEYYDIMEDESGQSTAGKAELLIEKHRHGALDTVGMIFDGPTTTFSDVSKSSQFPTQKAAPMPVNRDESDIPF